MFNMKKEKIILPPVPPLPELKTESKTPTQPQNNDDYNNIMNYFKYLDQRLEEALLNQSKIYDLIHDNTLTIRDQNMRIRELILNSLVDLPKFSTEDKK